MPVSKEDLLRPLSFDDGRRVIDASPPTSLHERVLHGRALLATQAYEAALCELSDLLPKLRGKSVRARVRIDLLTLAYYTARHEDTEALFQAGYRDALEEPLLLAEAYIALSMVSVARNDLLRSINALHWAADSLRPLPMSRDRALVAGKLYRQFAHVLAQSADYTHAQRMAQAACDAARETGDAIEVARSSYAAGFVALLAGWTSAAIDLLVPAEQITREHGFPLWRWILLCLGRANTEAGKPLEGARLARESGFDLPDEHAFLAMCEGDIAGARRVLDNARPPSADERPFRRVIHTLLRIEGGDSAGAIEDLDEAAEEFAAGGLRHYELGARIHAAYARDQQRRGAAASVLPQVVRALALGRAQGFAWFRPVVALWLAEASARIEPELAAALRARARAWAETAACELADDATTWRQRGLTWRELRIAQVITREHAMGNPRKPRKQLAAELNISTPTLKVHLTRIRQKLGVTSRGDAELVTVLLDGMASHALPRQRPPPLAMVPRTQLVGALKSIG